MFMKNIDNANTITILEKFKMNKLKNIFIFIKINLILLNNK